MMIPDDVNGECNAHLCLYDSRVIRCYLPKGHAKKHEKILRQDDDSKTTIAWDVDERDYNAHPEMIS